jgi:general secretion pathway protein C
MKFSRDVPLMIYCSVIVILVANIFLQYHQIRYGGFLPRKDRNAVVRVEKSSSAGVSEDIFFDAEVEDSDIPLKLLGTVIGTPSLAFIYNGNTRKRNLYHEHDNVEGFFIKRINAGKIDVEKNGVVTELAIMRGSDTAERMANLVEDEQDGIYIINKMELMGQMLKANELIAKVRVAPIPDGTTNRLSGFRIDNVPSGSLIEEVGIRNGDVILAVQGKRLQSMQDAWQMFNRVQSQSRIEVVLLRHEQPMTLRYEIR